MDEIRFAATVAVRYCHNWMGGATVVVGDGPICAQSSTHGGGTAYGFGVLFLKPEDIPEGWLPDEQVARIVDGLITEEWLYHAANARLSGFLCRGVIDDPVWVITAPAAEVKARYK